MRQTVIEYCEECNGTGKSIYPFAIIKVKPIKSSVKWPKTIIELEECKCSNGVLRASVIDNEYIDKT